MKQVVVIMMGFLFFGCQEVKRPEEPENLISKDRMVQILTDGYIGNATRAIDNRRLRSDGIFLDSILYRKYGIDSLQFAASNAYYTSDLNGYKALLQEVEKSLVMRQKVVDSLYEIEKEEAKRKQDSIKKQDSLKNFPLKKLHKDTLAIPLQGVKE